MAGYKEVRKLLYIIILVLCIKNKKYNFDPLSYNYNKLQLGKEEKSILVFKFQYIYYNFIRFFPKGDSYIKSIKSDDDHPTILKKGRKTARNGKRKKQKQSKSDLTRY